jgi:hypothetical protein
MITAIIRLPFIHPVIITMLFLFILSGNLCSQVNDCSFTYYNAMNLYNMGKIDTAYSLFTSCLDNKKLFRKTSKSTRADIYRLSALSSILLDNPDDARIHIKKMLAYKPYYENEFVQADLMEFKRMVKQYTVQPRLVLGINWFQDFSKLTLERTMTSHTSTYWPELWSYTESGLGFHVEYPFMKNFLAGIGMNLLYMSFMYNGSPVPFYNSFSYYTPIRYLETPLFAVYKLRIKKKIIPYFQAGIIGRYSTSGGVLKYESSNYGDFYIVRNMGNLAVFFNDFENLDFFIGGGVKYSFKRSSFDLDLGFFPVKFNRNILEDIESVKDLPPDEEFTHADEIIVIDLNRKIRLKFSYAYYFSFKAF